jgi:hypothetical protein
MDLDDLETISFDALGGSDNVTTICPAPREPRSLYGLLRLAILAGTP